MKTVKIHYASTQSNGFVILADEPVVFGQAKETYVEDAQDLFGVLFHMLPSGTFLELKRLLDIATTDN